MLRHWRYYPNPLPMKQSLLAFLLCITLFSCQKNYDKPAIQDGSTSRGGDISIFREEPGSGDCVTPLSNELVSFPDDNGAVHGGGLVTVSNDDDYLYIVVNTPNPETWISSASVLYGDATVINDKTQYSSDPMIGLSKPQLTAKPESPQHVYTFQVALSSVNGNCTMINVHAVFYTLDGIGQQVKFPLWLAPVAPPVTNDPWSAYVEYCAQFCAKPTCGQLRTQTPGGWGSAPSGNNAGSYLSANFANAFPSGLTVGCSPDYNMTFTSNTAVMRFLPAGGKAQTLTMNYIDPVGIKNVLAGHLVALSLSVGFDEADVDFGEAGIALGAMKIKNGAFKDWTVTDFLTEANQVFGGCSTSYSLQQVLQAAASINENYVDGLTDNGYLVCP